MQSDVVSNENLEGKKISFKWYVPKVVSLYVSKKLLEGAIGRFIRTLLVVVVVELIAYYFLSMLPFKQVDFDLQRALLVVFLYAIAISIYCYLAGPYFIRYSKKRYLITDKYIKSSGKLASWKGLLGYSKIEMSSEYENVLTISYYMKSSRSAKSFFFDVSQRELAEKVFFLLKEKLPDGESYAFEEKTRLELSNIQHVIPLLVLGAWVCLVCINFDFIVSIGVETVLLSLFPLIIVAGPGTLGMLILFGSKFFKCRDVWLYAYLYNYISLGVLFVTLLFCQAFEWAAIIDKYS